MNNNQETDSAANAPNIHIIDETERDLLLAVRIDKTTLLANQTFILALLELTSLLTPET